MGIKKRNTDSAPSGFWRNGWVLARPRKWKGIQHARKNMSGNGGKRVCTRGKVGR